MFESLTNKLSSVFSKLTSRGVLSEKDIDAAMEEIKDALIDADVSLSVIKKFISEVKANSLGEKLIRSVTPGQLIIKLVYDQLVKALGSENCSIKFGASPSVILMVGLQGSGKTTTAAKLAKRLKDKQNKKVLLASLDIYRPAAQEQLAQLAEQIGGHSLPIIAGQSVEDITKRALEEGKKGCYDVIVLDSAGRLQIDEVLMQEVLKVKQLANPAEILLVADAMLGQTSCEVAKAFNDYLSITGIALTRIDGTGRCGAALSMKSVSGADIKFMGTGEKLEDFEEFHPERIAGKILGHGDIVSLVERAMEKIEQDEAQRLNERIMMGKFNLEDMLSQFKQIKKMGSLSSIASMLPGMGQFASKLASADSANMLKRQEAIILSMTIKERKNPDIIKANRRKRIALGAGVDVSEVNKLLKSYEQMETLFKRMGKLGGMASMLNSPLIKNSPLGNIFGGNNKFPF